MKEGWKIVKLGEICETSAGGTPSKMHREYYEGGKIPWMLSGEVCQKYIYEVEHYITSEGLENSSAKIFPINTVVVAMYGATAGQVGILKIESSTNQAVCGILPNDEMSPEFLYYYFLYYKDILVTQAVGNAQPNISQQKIKAVEIPLLSLEEQHRIVGILDAAFAKIDALKANAEANLANAKALFQQVLAQELQPKEGWVEKKLEEIVAESCSLSYGIVQPGDDVVDGVPIIRPVDFNGKIFIKNKGLKKTKKEISDAYQRTILTGNEILMCVRGTTGTMGLATDELKGCNVTRGIVPILLNEKSDKLFVYYQLLSPLLQIQIAEKTKGAALKQINIKDLRKIQLYMPIIAEQHRIVFTLDTLSEKCRRLEQVAQQTIRECDALKQSILRQAFSGEL